MLAMTKQTREEFINYVVSMESMDIIEPEASIEESNKITKTIRNYYKQLSDEQLSYIADELSIVLV